MINEETANCSFKQVRFDQRLEGAEEISHTDAYRKPFQAETIAETKSQGWNVPGVFMCPGVA